jgi:hypothetical protein
MGQPAAITSLDRRLAAVLATLGWLALGTQLLLFMQTQIMAGNTAAWGKRFDRGNFSVSYEFYDRKPLLVRERDYLNCA